MICVICTTCVGQKLKEALDMQLFQRAAEDQFAWIREAQKHLDSDNIGKDLLSVRFLLKKHEVCAHPLTLVHHYVQHMHSITRVFWCVIHLILQQLETDLSYHEEQVRALSATADKLVHAGHFEAPAIRATCKELNDK